jgi:uncharacterized protein
MSHENASIGALAVNLHIPASQSLKSKRRVIKSIKDRVRSRFNVSVSEIGELEKWQSATLGFCMISNDRAHIQSNFEAILALVESVGEIRMLNHQLEFI